MVSSGTDKRTVITNLTKVSTAISQTQHDISSEEIHLEMTKQEPEIVETERYLEEISFDVQKPQKEFSEVKFNIKTNPQNMVVTEVTRETETIEDSRHITVSKLDQPVDIELSESTSMSVYETVDEENTYQSAKRHDISQVEHNLSSEVDITEQKIFSEEILLDINKPKNKLSEVQLMVQIKQEDDKEVSETFEEITQITFLEKDKIKQIKEQSVETSAHEETIEIDIKPEEHENILVHEETLTTENKKTQESCSTI